MTDSNPIAPNPNQHPGVPVALQPVPQAPAYGQPTQNGYNQQPYTVPAYGQPQSPLGGSSANDSEPPLNQPWYGAPFGGAIQRGIKKLFVFTGRASRSEYWWWWLGMVIINVALTVLMMVAPFFLYISLLWDVAALVLNYGITVRRGHDANKSTIVTTIPYAIMALGLIIWLFVVFQLLSGAISGSAISMVNALADTSQAQAALTVGELMIIVGGLTILVFMLTGSKPAGAQYDHLPAFEYGSKPSAVAAASPARFGVSAPTAPAAPAAPQFNASANNDDEDGATVLGSYHPQPAGNGAAQAAPAAPAAPTWQSVPQPAPAYGQQAQATPAGASFPAFPGTPATAQPTAQPTAQSATPSQTQPVAPSDDDMDATVLGSYRPQR